MLTAVQQLMSSLCILWFRLILIALVKRERPLESVNLYIGNVANHDSMISSGLCYRHQSGHSTLTNLYYFFEAQRGQQKIYDKLMVSIHTPFSELPIEQLLAPVVQKIPAWPA